jgi:hypothetical protein
VLHAPPHVQQVGPGKGRDRHDPTQHDYSIVRPDGAHHAFTVHGMGSRLVGGWGIEAVAVLNLAREPVVREAKVLRLGDDCRKARDGCEDEIFQSRPWRVPPFDLTRGNGGSQRQAAALTVNNPFDRPGRSQPR